MNERATHSVSFRVFHPSKTADEIAAEIGLSVDVCQSVGNPRVTPKGATLEGVYQRTFVAFDVKMREGEEVEEALSRVLEEMRNGKMQYLSGLVATGGRVEFFIGLFCNGKNVGLVIDADLIKNLASTGISLSFDIYG